MTAPHALAENHFQTHDGVSLFYRHRPATGAAPSSCSTGATNTRGAWPT